jgi:hypothetical protein
MEEDQRVLLFTYSLFLDLGLYSCPNSADPALWRTSTTEQLHEVTSETAVWNIPNDPMDAVYVHDEQSSASKYTCGKAQFNGTVLRGGAEAEGVPLPEGFPADWEGTKRPVALYLRKLPSGNYITDTKNDGTKPIGYILPAKVCPNGQGPFCGKPLQLFKTCPGVPLALCKPNNQKYLTTTMTTLPGPFAGLSGELLGYLINLSK